ncbi:MAG: hypothetical protein J6N20_20400, partial [Pseudomonas sp.]|nr:hypothetical protein [Pseudomonas sp.]
VVYEVTDETDFAYMAETLKTSMVTGEQPLACAKIHACGWGDFITQAAAYSEEVIHGGGICKDVLITHIQEEDRNLNREQATVLAVAVDPELE